MRVAIREIDELLPQAATTSRDLAIHVLTSNRGNVQCLYHWKETETNDRDGPHPDRSHEIVGIPQKRVCKSRKGDPVEPKKGYMACGCRIDTGLLDFFLFKTWTIANDKKDDYEGMRGTLFSPRLREFVVQAFMHQAGLSLDQLYTDDPTPDWDAPENQRRVLLLQTATLMRRLQQVSEAAKAEWKVTSQILALLLSDNPPRLTLSDDGISPIGLTLEQQLHGKPTFEAMSLGGEKGESDSVAGDKDVDDLARTTELGGKSVQAG
jgi:hypothetical protein